jgi:integrase
VSKAELLGVIQKLEARGVGYSAHKLLTHCRQIWALAMDEEIIDRDPTVTLRKQLKAYKVTHHPAITDPVKLGELLRAMDGYTGNIVTTSALRLAPVLFVRTGELRHALWQDIDLDRAEWAYISTKTHTPHIVPLPTQAVTILTTLHEVTGGGELVFPGTRSKTKPISDNTINAALRYLGFSGDDVVGHGFRATARTILDEVLQYPPHIIEQQLAHAVKDPNGRAYNRTAHLPQRTAMMQGWADYLDKLKAGAEVIPFARVA